MYIQNVTLMWHISVVPINTKFVKLVALKKACFKENTNPGLEGIFLREVHIFLTDVWVVDGLHQHNLDQLKQGLLFNKHLADEHVS